MPDISMHLLHMLLRFQFIKMGDSSQRFSQLKKKIRICLLLSKMKNKGETTTSNVSQAT